MFIGLPFRPRWTPLIDARLRTIAETAKSRLPWYEAFQALNSSSTLEQRLAVYQAAGRAGSIPRNAAFYANYELICQIADRDAAVLRRKGTHKLRAIKNKLFDACNRDWERVIGLKIPELADPRMVSLMREDSQHFWDELRAGWDFFQNTHAAMTGPADWVRALTNDVAKCVTIKGRIKRMAVFCNHDCSVIDVVPVSKELQRGSVRGLLPVNGFSVDLEQLRKVFDSVESCVWQSFRFPSPEKTFASIRGIYQGHEVLVRSSYYALEGTELAFTVDPSRRIAPPWTIC